ncbi:MAG: aspartate carbamoyltransferase regulatory subunit [Methanomicrobia archaeon]|nr:aspartate carbamoyltransferase regulatory subunit [Methanomicrobia archaeon]RLF95288.1 MAG: aspartate carbamoyltransferase regulatory subunit [Thermococci archaeon]HDN81381.1 aspartate carbamoyltransferase regulatory subunit [Methanomicrobia archaeon]
MKKELKVSAIKNGTVIDHIRPGKALEVVRLLNLENYEDSVTVAMSVRSSLHKTKDIVKIENRELSEEEVNEIALIAPESTINIIKDYEVVEKRKIELPDVIKGILTCMNPNCISRKEGSSKFIVEKREPVVLRCYYCERLMEEGEILKRLRI